MRCCISTNRDLSPMLFDDEEEETSCIPSASMLPLHSDNFSYKTIVEFINFLKTMKILPLPTDEDESCDS